MAGGGAGRVQEVKLAFLFDISGSFHQKNLSLDWFFPPIYTNNTKNALETEAQPHRMREEEMRPPAKGTRLRSEYIISLLLSDVAPVSVVLWFYNESQ